MRVLLISYYYPPDPAVGAIRAGRIAASLVAAGHTVQVLAARKEGIPSRTEDGGVSVRRLPNVVDVRRALVGAKKALAPQSNGRDAASDGSVWDREQAGPAWNPPTEVRMWRRYLGAAIWLPDDQQGWIPSLVAAGLGAIAKGVDLVYTTAPPFSAHIAGLLLKTLTGKPWIAELRDPWIGNPWKPWYVRSRGTDAVDAWLERRCLKNADRFVAVTASAARELAVRRGQHGAVVLIRNGIPPIPAISEPSSAQVEPERSVVYLGTLYQGRDPRPFLEALAHLRQAGRLPPVRMEFIGNCSHYMGKDLASFCEELGIGDVVRFVPPIPHTECQERIRRADLLLLLAQEQPSQVPQKLYEYLATGRPIIAFADEEGESAEMLREAGGHYVVTGSAPQEVADALDAALHADRGRTATDPSVLREWSVEAQMQRLVKLVEEVAA